MSPAALRPRTMRVEDWRSGFGVVKPDEQEIISVPLWETQDYVSAATTQLTFFNQVPATVFDGNLLLAGQLPSGNFFLIMAIRFCPFPDTTQLADAAGANGASDGALQDIVALTREGIGTLRVGDKDYGTWPLLMLPGGGGAYGGFGNVGTSAAASLQQVQYGSNGVPDPRSVYTLPIPLMIPPQYNFDVQLRWRAVQTLTAGNTRCFVILDGELMRPVQ